MKVCFLHAMSGVFIGIAPDARLLVCKVTGSKTKKIHQAIAEALRWIKEQPDIDVVSISIGSNYKRDERDEAVKELVHEEWENCFLCCR